MIRLLRGMPPGVLGLEAVDDVGREDHVDVGGPAIERAVAQHGEVRLVHVLGHEFDRRPVGAPRGDGAQRALAR